MVSLQVGSGAGSSAVEWGKLVKETGGVVLCIDPWVGDLPMWYSEGWREAMAWEDGQVGSTLTLTPSPNCSPPVSLMKLSLQQASAFILAECN